LGSDGRGVVHKGIEGGAEALGEFLRSMGDEVAEVIGFET
jgi:hypothetical protein